MTSGDWIHLVEFWPFLRREMAVVASSLLFCRANPIGNGLTLKGKNLLQVGSNSFLLE